MEVFLKNDTTCHRKCCEAATIFIALIYATEGKHVFLIAALHLWCVKMVVRSTQ